MDNNETKEFTGDKLTDNSLPSKKTPLTPTLSRKGRGSRTAFTLAEVLITLGIIGIVAAMTMPTLIANHQKKQTAVKLKKAYAELSQALNQAQVQNGMMETWDFSALATGEEKTKYFSEKYLLPNIRTIKSCVPTSSECWSDTVSTLDNIKINYISSYDVAHASFITASGYSVYYWVSLAVPSAWFFIDINGKGKPNIVGKDVFPFTIFFSEYSTTACPQIVTGLKPAGFSCASIDYNKDMLINSSQYDFGGSTSYKDYACKKGTGLSGAGYFCSGLIMLDNWEITKDYPW